MERIPFHPTICPKWLFTISNEMERIPFCKAGHGSVRVSFGSFGHPTCARQVWKFSTRDSNENVENRPVFKWFRWFLVGLLRLDWVFLTLGTLATLETYPSSPPCASSTIRFFGGSTPTRLPLWPSSLTSSLAGPCA